MLDATAIVDRLRLLESRYRERDQRWQDVLSARRGELDRVFPDLVSEEWPKPIVANMIDVAARDLAEMIAPLPAFNCSSSTMTSDAARKAADKRSKIAQHYVQHSRLGVQMLTGADHYLSYARAVLYIEPDLDARMPRITVENPVGGYAELDRWGRCVAYTRRMLAEPDVLATMYPDYADVILAQAKADRLKPSHNKIELVRYCDRDQITLVMAADHSIALETAENPLGECPVVLVQRPWLDSEDPKGQLDDVLWVQLARDTLAKLQLAAVSEAVQAPLALPQDVQELPYGPNAVIRTASPEKVRRVGLELSPAAFTESQLLAEEVRQGARYPNVRTGGTNASIITGKGVQALLGGFDSQIKTAQLAFQDGFTEAIRLCFKLDESLWPGREKEIRGQANGTPYNLKYRPSRDIAGDHSVDVSYGFAMGLDPNRATVMLLQLRAERLFSRDFMARQLPFEFDVSSEMTKVEVEQARDALMQAMAAYVQAIPAMAQVGQDPSQAVNRVALIVRELQKGRAVEDVVAEAFTPQPPPQPQEVPGGEGAGGGAGGGAAGAAGGNALGAGLTPSGLMRGVPEGQAGAAPGGRPDLSVMLAGLTGNGQPSMSAFTMRRRRF